MAPKKKSKTTKVSVWVQRDYLFLRAVCIARAFVENQATRGPNAFDGGGVHVGPPHGTPIRRGGFVCDFSFKLDLSPDDDSLLESVFVLVLGGVRVQYDPAGNENWPIERK
jgi:hypothetical protein